ncbi:hypothetical protein EUX98_g5624 [Antrodiella citrinella]|uniref:DUF7729 domain-containing protein n=1 Tax=Antrodiella citrinella TaxID=2447956 RepID=A0A4S4MR39_9APHY|nr:hypothetical protein EUX98_g5624 [Antrodiella citrinella]
MKSFAAISLIAAALVSAAPSALIPAGISSGCTTFLTSFDNDTSLASCTGPIISATAQFLNATATPSSSAIQSALGTLCAVSCNEQTVRTKVSDFYAACTAELTSSKNDNVVQLYDTLYTLIPFQQAACAKDDSGDYCVGQTPGKIAVSSLYTNVGSGAQAVLSPNSDTFADNNIAFLLLQASTPKAQLCTSCARTVLTSFVSWESDTPYAPGLTQSKILNGQSALYTSVTSTCGATFLSGAVQAAGGLSGGILSPSSDASHTLISSVGAVVGALAAAVYML